MRWLKITIRTMHLTGIAGMSAMFFSTPVNYDYYPFAILLYSSGLLLMTLEIWSNGVWLIQLRGIAIYLKLIILSFLYICPGHGTLMMTLLIVISGIISHAPADVRYYSIVHGRRISSLS